jgi:hypothetical protein
VNDVGDDALLALAALISSSIVAQRLRSIDFW